jgi:hypothetical protein
VTQSLEGGRELVGTQSEFCAIHEIIESAHVELVDLSVYGGERAGFCVASWWSIKKICHNAFIGGQVIISSVVSPVEPPIESFGNDGLLQIWQ